MGAPLVWGTRLVCAHTENGPESGQGPEDHGAQLLPGSCPPSGKVPTAPAGNAPHCPQGSPGPFTWTPQSPFPQAPALSFPQTLSVALSGE